MTPLKSSYPPPRNHPQQVASRKRQNSALFGAESTTDQVDTRGTDPALFRRINDEFNFTIDVAANSENAKCARFYTIEEDGLRQSWANETVWCNPPYSDLLSWVRKATTEASATVVMLLPANRTEQPFWQTYIEPFRDGGGACRDTLHRRTPEVQRIRRRRFGALRECARDF